VQNGSRCGLTTGVAAVVFPGIIKEVGVMKKMVFFVLAVLVAVAFFRHTGSAADQDKNTLKAPNGISFSEVRGYEDWPATAVSYRTDNHEVRAIVANAVMIEAYKAGIPGNGKPFPDGSVIVKIGWSERKNAAFPAALEPDALRRVEFIMKDSKRFPDTSGWGYARFVYDAKTDAFAPYGKDARFGQECHQCHTLVKAKDFIFTGYPKR
jgi:hypothetical protein